MATGMVSTPFPLGLDASGVAANDQQEANVVTASAQPSVEAAFAGSNGYGTESNDFLDDVRKAVLQEVDAKLADKMKGMWSRGNKMLKQIEQENKEQTAKLLEELAERQKRQEQLKAEQEQLKTLMASMVQQFSMLSAAYGPAPLTPSGSTAFPPMPTPSSPSVGPCDASSSTTDASMLPDTPPPGLGPKNEKFLKMPDYPCPTPSTSAQTPSSTTATPLSLVAALGGDTPSSAVPVSLESSLPPPASSEYGRIFSFTLRKADGTELGINLSHHESDKMLRVEGIRPDGAVEAWNRQCIGSAAADKAIVPGDRIMSVNQVANEPVKMLEECRQKQLLKFTILRGGPPGAQSPVAGATTAAAAKTTTMLRADATEFVPGGM